MNLQEYLKFCKVFAIPLSGKQCLSIFKHVADASNNDGNGIRRNKSLPKPEASQPNFTLDYFGFKKAL